MSFRKYILKEDMFFAWLCEKHLLTIKNKNVKIMLYNNKYSYKTKFYLGGLKRCLILKIQIQGEQM